MLPEATEKVTAAWTDHSSDRCCPPDFFNFNPLIAVKIRGKGDHLRFYRTIPSTPPVFQWLL
ncbi:hypothetical protein CF651_21765 [Paenibacillus rigui]|uniref:Uncharacterized protein n=1 Tax=Paenibacillus rigui TaxID=554312 RepID=A0A229UL98_9BACL|nr:hypothetical protein CF651_21765 [Paenibacillus rigui]